VTNLLGLFSTLMDIIFLLIPLALLLVGIAISSFIWAVNKDQFEDLKGPAHSILLDDDRPEYLSNRTQNSVY